MATSKNLEPATQQVDLCRRLREEIILGRLPHGRRITEKYLADHMRVKRGPARESLLILEGQGLIRKVPSLGYFVESHSAEEIRDVYDLRLALETMAVRRAALQAAREDLVRFELIGEEERAAMSRGDKDARVRCDLDFHQTIVNASGSRVLVRAYASVARPIYGSADLSAEKTARVVAQHAAIGKAIRARDPDRAVALLRRHITEHNQADACARTGARKSRGGL